VLNFYRGDWLLYLGCSGCSLLFSFLEHALGIYLLVFEMTHVTYYLESGFPVVSFAVSAASAAGATAAAAVASAVGAASALDVLAERNGASGYPSRKKLKSSPSWASDCCPARK